MKKSIIIFFLIIFFGFIQKAESAVLYFSPEVENAGVGREFYVDYKVNTESDFINATQATIKFSNNIVEVVGIDTQNSVFGFWLQEPDFSNEKGEISFIGGSGKGLQGSALQILRVRFKAIGLGVANFETTNPVVTANDGKGSNVLRVVENADVSIGAGTGTRPTAVTTTTTTKTAPVVELPQRVERVATPAVGLPQKPVVRVPLYPDEKAWYNHQSEATVFWDIPSDVTKVGISVDRNPGSTPVKAEDELFTGKNIGILNEGINYIHVQFRNNKGWGPVAHYRVAVDLSEPQFFEIEMDSVNSDNPTPEIKYIGLDGLSGFDRALITVDNQEPIISTSSPEKLKPQYPGRHTVIVKVFDKAGNSFSDDLSFDIIPLQTPQVSFATASLSQDEKGFAFGVSLPNTILDYRILDKDIVVASGSVDVDSSGKWEVAIAEGLDRGNYNLIFSARDTRGAVSYPTENLSLKVKAKTILSLGFVDFSLVELIIIFVLLAGSVTGFVSWYYITEEDKQYAYKVIAGRDVENLGNLLNKHIQELLLILDSQKRLPGDFRVTVEMVLKKMSDDVEKIKKYVGRQLK